MMEKEAENLFDDQFTRLVRSLKSLSRHDVLSEDFAKKKSDEDRMRFVLSLDVIHQHVAVPQLDEVKSSQLANKFRNKGNKLFQEKNYKSSLLLYTRSVAHAPHYRDASEDIDSELALAYANRSAALYYLGQWNDCLLDIANALQCSYPQRLRHKLYTRKGQCLMKLNKYEEAVEAFKASKKVLASIADSVPKKSLLLQELDNNIKKGMEGFKCVDTSGNIGMDPFYGICSDRLQPELLEGIRNSKFPSLSSSCDVTYSPTQGRYLVANRDIFPGEVILVEKPYASIVLHENYANFCHHCFKFSYSLMPCPRCTEALYCSQTCCMASLESYHKYECGLLRILRCSGIGKFGHLALRTLLKVNCNNIIKYRDMLVSFDKQTSPLEQGCDDDGLYLSNNYRTIHCLVTHSDDRTVSDLFHRSVVAVFLLKCAQKSGYFSECSDPLYDEIMPFVGGLLLSHLQSFPCNAHEIAEFELNKQNLVESAPMELGAGIYSTLSLFNHSCDPDVNRNFYGDVCVVRAIKTIRRGDEISDNYGTVYAVHPREQRRKKLQSQYFFHCRCLPCQQDWPLYPCIEDVRPQWRCTNCRMPMLDDDGGSLTCKQCKVKESTSERLSKLVPSQEKYNNAFEKLMSCDVDSSLSGLLEYLKVLDDNLCLPWREYNNCQEAVKQCFSIMSNCHIIAK